MCIKVFKSFLKFTVLKFCLEVFFRYLLKLKFKKKIGFSVHFIEQWHFEVGLFALKSDFCVILRIPYVYFTIFYNYDNCRLFSAK